MNPRDFVVHPLPVNGPQDRWDRPAAIGGVTRTVREVEPATAAA